MRQVKKITPKTVLKKIEKTQQDRLVYTVIGIANGVRRGEGNYGPWTAISGTIRAILPDGEMVESTECFLPEPFNSQLAQTVERTNQETGEVVTTPVEFGVQVWQIPSDVGVGYEWIAKPVLDQVEADPLSGIMNRLPAPVKDASSAVK